MKIVIQTIPHQDHRYETCGDYWVDKEGTIQVRVSQMSDQRYEALVAVHEIVEKLLCSQRGITDAEIDAFDIAFEKERAEGMHGDDVEAGDDKRAPYRKEHFFATSIERLLAAELGVDWATYDNEVMSL